MSLKTQKCIAIVLFVLALVDTFSEVTQGKAYNLFWFCNISLNIDAFGLYFRKPIVLTAAFLGAVTGQIPWFLDFFSQLALHYPLFGVTSYMFEYGFHNPRFYVELNHFLTLPMSIYGMKRMGIHRMGWILASLCAIILNAGAYFFAPVSDNVNCVHALCIYPSFSLPYNPAMYFIVWTAFLSLVFLIENLILDRRILSGKSSAKP